MTQKPNLYFDPCVFFKNLKHKIQHIFVTFVYTLKLKQDNALRIFFFLFMVASTPEQYNLSGTLGWAKLFH